MGGWLGLRTLHGASIVEIEVGRLSIRLYILRVRLQIYKLYTEQAS